MRVCSLVLALVLASSTVAFGQNKGAGVRIGVNFSNPTVDPVDEFNLDSRTGIVGGIFYVAPIAPHFSIQPEFLYSQKRAEISAEGFSADVDLDYFDVPILLRWDSTSSGNSTFNVFGGPSINFLQRARQKSPEGEEDLKDEVERVDVGIVFGAGVELGRFVLDGRYQLGLKNLNKETDIDGIEIKHRTFSITAGFRF